MGGATRAGARSTARPRPARTRSAFPRAGQSDPAPAPRRAHRARDPDRRAPRGLGRRLRDRPQARALHRLHDRDRRGRQCVRAPRAGALDDADDSGAQARGPRREARWLRADGGEPGPARGGSRRAGPLHDAHEGALEALRFRVNGLRGLQTAFQETADATDAAAAGPSSRRRASGCSRATSSGPTRSGPAPRRSRVGGGGRARGAHLGVRRRRRDHVAVRPGCDLAAHPGRLDRRDADRPARERNLVRQSAPERPAPLRRPPRPRSW